jgi:hypothetical protein
VARTNGTRDTEDIVTLFALMDAKKVLLPMFITINLAGLPPIPTGTSTQPHPVNRAVVALQASVRELQKQMDTVLLKLDEIKVGQTSVHSASTTAQSSKNAFVDYFAPLADATGVLNQITGQSKPLQPSWADHAARIALNRQPFRPSPTLQNKLIYGKGPVSSLVEAVPRQLICVAGRLDKERTAEDLQAYLVDAGIRDAVCRKLVPNNGMTFKTTAFRVSCGSQYKDLFCNESAWPEGCELRDWYNKNRISNAYDAINDQ